MFHENNNACHVNNNLSGGCTCQHEKETTGFFKGQECLVASSASIQELRRPRTGTHEGSACHERSQGRNPEGPHEVFAFTSTLWRNTAKWNIQIKSWWWCGEEQMTWRHPTASLAANKNRRKCSSLNRIIRKNRDRDFVCEPLCQLGMWYISHGCVKHGSLARQINR